MESIYEEALISDISREVNRLKFVEESVVVFRNDAEGKRCIVVYAASKKAINNEVIDNLKYTLEEHVPKDIKLYIVQVVSIPKKLNSKIDLETLHFIPVLDEELIPIWQKQLQEHFRTQGLQIAVLDNKRSLDYYHSLEIKGYNLVTSSVQYDFPHAEEVPKFKEHNKDITKAESLAIVHGESLTIPEISPKTMIEAILNVIKNYPHRGITYLQGDQQSKFCNYLELFNKATRLITLLVENACNPRDIVIIITSELEEHLTLFWACILGGMIPITIAVPQVFNENNSIARKFLSIWQFLGKPQIACSNELALEIDNFINEKGYTIPLQDFNKFVPYSNLYQAKPEDILFLQATSGSTGNAKCVQITNKGIISYIHATKYNYTDQSITLNWLPHDHVAPVLTYHLKDLYLGINQIKVPTEDILFKPLRWLYYMDRYKVTHSWAPNFAFKLVCEELKKSPKIELDLSSVVCLMNAGEQVVFEVVRNFIENLKPYGLKQQVVSPAYGMAETCTAVTYSHDFIQENFNILAPRIVIHQDNNITFLDSVADTLNSTHMTRIVDLGAPVSGVSIRIVDQDQNIVKQRVIGKVEIKGDVVTSGYFNNPQANKEAFSDSGWFNTGDLGYINNNRLTITGREKEIIIIRGANFSCSEIEEVISNIYGVKPTYCAAISTYDFHNKTEHLVIFFVPLFNLVGNFDLVRTIKECIAEKIGINATYIIPIMENQFPKTTSGKIQRSLLKDNFLNGKYDNLKHEFDKFLNSERLIPKWFYRRLWSNIPIKYKKKVEKITSVIAIFIRKTEIDFYRKNLRLDNVQIVTVILGEKFEVIDNQLFEIDKNNLNSYINLFRTLQSKDLSITNILHFGSCTIDDIKDFSIEDIRNAHKFSIGSIVLILNALNKLDDFIKDTQKIYFIIISCNAQPVFGHDFTNLIHSAVPAITQVINSEFNNITSKHIDFSKHDLETNLTNLLEQELYVNQDQELEISYRNGLRYVPRLEQIDPLLNDSKQILKLNGTYIITGGLGGIGVHICQYLLDKYQAELIVLGRTNKEKFSLEQRKAYDLLESTSGGLLSYYEVDICNFEKLQNIINNIIKKRSIKIDAIFHIAGTYEENLLIDETIDSFEKTFYTKIYGAWNLHKIIIQHNPEATFISFSSLVSHFGSAMLGSYVVANRFLEGLATYQNHFSALKAYSLLWSNWSNTGMSIGYNENISKGFCGINFKRGLVSLELSLQENPSSILIGLDGNNRNIVSSVLSATYLSKSLSLYLKFNLSQDDNYLSGVQQPLLLDPFGTLIPLNTLIKKDNNDTSSNSLTDNEKIDESCVITTELAGIWKDILEIDSINGCEDNFFDLGGNSLLLIQLQSQIKQRISSVVKVSELIKNPSIKLQVTLIKQRLCNNN